MELSEYSPPRYQDFSTPEVANHKDSYSRKAFHDHFFENTDLTSFIENR